MTEPGPVRPDEDRSLGEIVSEVSENASRLVREEIELAKAEVTERAKTLGAGIGIGVAAGLFLALSLIYFLHGLAYFFQDLLDTEVWVGYLIVTVILVILAVIAGLLARRFFKRGSPPTPEMAIEQAKLTRDSLEHAVEGDAPPLPSAGATAEAAAAREGTS